MAPADVSCTEIFSFLFVVSIERRTGVRTGAVAGSLGKERNESVEGKYRVHVPKWNAIRKC